MARRFSEGNIVDVEKQSAVAKLLEVDDNGQSRLDKERQASIAQVRTLNFVLTLLACVCVILGMFLLASTRFEHTKEGSLGRHPDLGTLSSIDPSLTYTLNSTEGAALLKHHDTLSYPFFEGGLSTHFATQETNCGVSTLVTILNALNLPTETMPTHPLWDQHRYFRQDNWETECTERIMPMEGVREDPGGVTLQQFARYVACFASSDYKNADRIMGGASGLSKIIERAMETPGHFLSANYRRASLGYDDGGGGHISAIAAYCPIRDMVLLLDGQKYRSAPLWVPVGMLFSAMDTEDACGEWTPMEDSAERIVDREEELDDKQEDALECAGYSSAQMEKKFQFPVCTPARRGVVLSCHRDSEEPCEL